MVQVQLDPDEDPVRLQPLPIDSSYLAEFSANQIKSIFSAGAVVSGGVGGTTSHPFCRFSLFSCNFCNSAISIFWAQVRLDPEAEGALAAASLFRVILFS